MNKKKWLIIAGIIIIVFIILNLMTNKTTEEKVQSYIENIGFQKLEDSELYYKQISDTSIKEYFEIIKQEQEATLNILYFNTKQFQLLKVLMEYSNSISTSFDATYDYKTEQITYTYEITKGDTLVMLEGNYLPDTKEFNCDVTYYENIKLYQNNNETVLCDKVKYDAENFAEETRTLITNPTLLQAMNS